MLPFDGYFETCTVVTTAEVAGPEPVTVVVIVRVVRLMYAEQNAFESDNLDVARSARRQRSALQSLNFISLFSIKVRELPNCLSHYGQQLQLWQDRLTGVKGPCLESAEGEP